MASSAGRTVVVVGNPKPASRTLGVAIDIARLVSGGDPDTVIDLATSATAYGKIEIAKRKGAAIPPSWAIDKNGHPATRADQMIEGGALLPLGGLDLGYKGFALGLMVEALTSALTGFGRAEGSDRFESEGLELQRAVAEAYEEIAKVASDRVVVVDGEGSVEEVHERVMSAVRTAQTQ